MITKSARLRSAVAGTLLLSLMGCAGQSNLEQDFLGGSNAANGPIDKKTFVEVLDTVFFLTDSSEITPQGKGLLNRQAQYLRQNPGIRVRLEGHADERGTREYNIALGARRSATVADYLVSLGINRRRLSVVSFGREKPLQTCADEACWSKNRRVQTVVF